MKFLTRKYIAELVHDELMNDVGSGDATSILLLSRGESISGAIMAKADGIVAGIDFAAAAFAIMSRGINFVQMKSDGDAVAPGEIIAKINGNAIAILSAERTALNFLGHLSGIATLTRKFVDAIAGTGAKILDTRKTMPGLRKIEKYAVQCGGGMNHRMGLYDMILVKDNHIASVGKIEDVLKKLYSAGKPELPVEVEVTDISQLAIVLQYPVDRVMLDNFTPANVRKAIEFRKKIKKITPFECSGGINLKNVREYAETGVEFISVGAITHSAKHLDISLEVCSKC